jgi:hypothetical protein
MSHVVKHTQCPECAKHGRDRSSDNLAVYSDGGKFCFSCGYFETGNGFSRLREDHQRSAEEITIPSDCTPANGGRAREFLSRYGITEFDIAINNILWSEYWQRIIFPYIIDDQLVAWQGRYLGTEKKAKWFTKGKIDEVSYTVGNPNGKSLVLVEDILSAIKISHSPSYLSMPLFGSHISQRRLLTIKRFYGMEVIIWLDNDKKMESVKFVNSARQLGLIARTVITEKDPKEYSRQEIEVILDKTKKA